MWSSVGVGGCRGSSPSATDVVIRMAGEAFVTCSGV